MPSRVWISIPRHSLACFTRASRLCPPPSSSHAKDYRLFAHRRQSHVSPARISLRRMRSQVAQAQSSNTPLTMRCPGPDQVKEQEAMTGSMSGKEKHDAEHRHGSLPQVRLDSCALQSWRPQNVDMTWLPLSTTTPFCFWHVSTHVAIPPFLLIRPKNPESLTVAMATSDVMAGAHSFCLTPACCIFHPEPEGHFH